LERGGAPVPEERQVQRRVEHGRRVDRALAPAGADRDGAPVVPAGGEIVARRARHRAVGREALVEGEAAAERHLARGRARGRGASGWRPRAVAGSSAGAAVAGAASSTSAHAESAASATATIAIRTRAPFTRRPPGRAPRRSRARAGGTCTSGGSRSRRRSGA